ncbi:putative Cys-tRNA(Pro)/Cys-tRNA(Cys) deacylase YjdI [Petrocella atlantisensis]|uniref:Cys-tRNA(Pro)/Cys-tRNA(Cys) deacylase n=1 Tax=Petrocella atlantisensis TaxID=2173034 RepID=A0A3P7S0W0_9FIRM|nr:Cys-tRNA(Pro) deacylase [Petrocella atlantisensis]VDN48352.1 putative Cys-tRNA(Pro)/Cys-tRNA(Cys) deacylase YjdI [Petrocella atlantisensis]
MKKTNAMRLLDRDKIPYTAYEYEVIDGKTDGLTVAMSINQEPERVYKTLVTIGASRTYYVYVIPVAKELDLKKAAKVAGEKKIDMIPMKDLLPTTGYIHGGCSPVGMKKLFKTFIDESCKNHKTLILSGGARGVQVEVELEDLLRVTSAEVEAVV